MGRRRRSGARVRARRRRCGRARRGRRRAQASRRACSWSGARYSSGWARPSSIASSMAVIDATGVRRSWLAAAMSSRRASKRLSSSEAIALNELPSLASSRGPPVGARTVRSPCARRSAEALSCSSGRVIDAASTRATATALAAAAAATARIFTSAPMWNITQPDSSTAASGRRTASSPKAASCARTADKPAQRQRAEQADGERRERDDDREMNHGTNL